VRPVVNRKNHDAGLLNRIRRDEWRARDEQLAGAPASVPTCPTWERQAAVARCLRSAARPGRLRPRCWKGQCNRGPGRAAALPARPNRSFAGASRLLETLHHFLVADHAAFSHLAQPLAHQRVLIGMQFDVVAYRLDCSAAPGSIARKTEAGVYCRNTERQKSGVVTAL